MRCSILHQFAAFRAVRQIPLPAAVRDFWTSGRGERTKQRARSKINGVARRRPAPAPLADVPAERRGPRRAREAAPGRNRPAPRGLQSKDQADSIKGARRRLGRLLARREARRGPAARIRVRPPHFVRRARELPREKSGLFRPPPVPTPSASSSSSSRRTSASMHRMASTWTASTGRASRKN